MRTGVAFTVSPDDQQRLEAIVADPNTKQKQRLACTHHSRKRTRTRHHGNHAPNRQVKGPVSGAGNAAICSKA